MNAPASLGRGGCLPYAVAAALEAGPHGAPVIVAPGNGLVGGDATASLGRVEAGLRRCPPVTLVPVIRLLLRRLAALWVDEDVFPLRRRPVRGRRRCAGVLRPLRTGNRGARVGGRVHDLVTLRARIRVVGVVGVVVRD